ncbi:MAG: ATP-binding cassette domain-containing protein [Bacteroidia bacterium]
MNRNVVRALIRLFAIVGSDVHTSRYGRHVVEQFILRLVSRDDLKEYMDIFDNHVANPAEKAEMQRDSKKRASASVKVLRICASLNEELTYSQKGVVFMRLAEFLNADGGLSEKDLEFLNTVAESFYLENEHFHECIDFVTGSEINSGSGFRAVICGVSPSSSTIPHIRWDGVDCVLHVFKFPSENVMFIKAINDCGISLNGRIILKHEILPFSVGSVLRSAVAGSIYHSDVAALFLQSEGKTGIVFSARNIEFRFKGGNKGLHKLSFTERSGNLIGIMGSSGAGKSTLLNVLNGNELPTSGKVLINGYDLHDPETTTKGLIGYVSQDDLLIAELTVFENLWFNACLCYANSSKMERLRKVYQTLEQLGLTEIRNLRVGDSLNKTISGGQRKRLNIALELLREPPVLFVDEPTSGLSSRDSEHIMNLLKELSLKGKLIFVVIHQPSSDIFKMFDRLVLLDTGGYPVYYGNPVDAVPYVKEIANHVSAVQGECHVCGNINPEQLFDIIEDQEVDEYGRTLNKRKITPKEWNLFYKRSRPENTDKSSEQTDLPDAQFKRPGKPGQFLIYCKRDVLRKIKNTQYLLISLLEAPVLAFIMAYLLRYSAGESYSLYDNLNIPAYLLVCVISALFFGLTVSAEEIFRDRGILRREKFLNLSRGSYLLSKISVLFALSAVQTVLFVLVGHLTIGFRELFFSDWLILFSTACFANLLGLNISSAFNSAVTIYILIPVLIIPQLLLSGLMVRYDQLNPALRADADRVPVSADLMTSRWAYEALAVNHFMNNRAEYPVFETDRIISNSNYMHHYWIPKMESMLAGIEEPVNAGLLMHEIERMNRTGHYNTYPNPENIVNQPLREYNRIADYLARVKKLTGSREIKARLQKDEIVESFGGEYSAMVKKYTNNQLSRLVLRQDQFTKIIEQMRRPALIRNFEPVFEYSDKSGLFRGTFYASEKQVFGRTFSTPYANILVIWLITILMAVLLYFDGLNFVLNRDYEFLKKLRKVLRR